MENNALCLACGFCCNGVLHTYTRVAASEVETLQRLETPLYPLQDGPEFAFTQHCPHWQENRCTIYVHRPMSCRTYECLLLKRLAAGLISTSASLARVQKTQKLIAQRDDPLSAFERDHLEARLRAGLHRHFEPEHILYRAADS
jgi:hypothetical protein